MALEFVEFPKIARLKRPMTVTEKLDGTNACVVISDDGTEIGAQSRSRMITPEDDNFGFARWVQENREELMRLGPGHHYGEWFGRGIGRKYGMTERRFALFNTNRWNPDNPNRPACCHVVPVLATGTSVNPDLILETLRTNGSYAVPGFMNPEGIIVYHAASRTYYKVTLEKDDEPKGKAA